MKSKSILISFITALSFIQVLNAQDIMIKKTQDTVFCKIREIGTDDIKYSLPNYPDDVDFSIDKNKVIKVVFSSGQEIRFQEEMTNPENYADNKKNALKIDFLSPMTGNLTLGYERSLKPGQSIEAAVGFIGAGKTSNDINPAGVFLKVGMKFIKSPDFYLRGMRYAHVLKGGYVKPEFAMSFYSRDYISYEHNYVTYNSTRTRNRESVVSGAVLLNLGKQWIYNNSFLVDFYGGVGYGFQTGEYDGGYQYGYEIITEELPLTFSAGLKIGFLFK